LPDFNGDYIASSFKTLKIAILEKMPPLLFFIMSRKERHFLRNSKINEISSCLFYFPMINKIRPFPEGAEIRKIH